MNSESTHINLSFTPTAQAYLENWLTKSPEKVIRFLIKMAGCSGWRYQFELADKPLEGDLRYSIRAELVIYLDLSSLPLLDGTTTDFKRQGLNGQFTFDHPRMAGSCGCGESVYFEENK